MNNEMREIKDQQIQKHNKNTNETQRRKNQKKNWTCKIAFIQAHETGINIYEKTNSRQDKPTNQNK